MCRCVCVIMYVRVCVGYDCELSISHTSQHFMFCVEIHESRYLDIYYIVYIYINDKLLLRTFQKAVFLKSRVM